MKIAIIGAGLAGLTLAHKLKAHAEVTIFEKSRGLGGRIATRYADPYQFDHGTQHFTAYHDSFRAFIQPMVEAGVIAPWHARFVEMSRNKVLSRRTWTGENIHYVGMPKMNAIGRYLAEGLEVVGSCRIETMAQHADSQWELTDDTGEHRGSYDWVISTAPPEQAYDLLPDSFAYKASLPQSKLLGCFALMLGFAEPLPLEFDAALVKQADISWMSVNSSKPGREETSFSLLVHATNRWAEAHMEDDPAQVQAHLLQEVSSIIEHDVSKADHIALHRWRYANIKKQTGPRGLVDEKNRLAACGDWCIQGRVEAAYLSAEYTAEAVLDSLN